MERDQAWAPGTPCWIDTSTSDLAETAAFYSRLFGWHVQPAGFGGYATALLHGRPVAGFVPATDDRPPVWTTYLASADTDATVHAITGLGGRVHTAPTDVGPLGRMALAADPTGSRVRRLAGE